MLMVFAFGITPRIFLHAWFAGHRDTSGVKISPSPHQQVYQHSYHCNCDNIVAESPFTNSTAAVHSVGSLNFTREITLAVPAIYTKAVAVFSLRGPPEIC
jgi:hypothetical protein